MEPLLFLAHRIPYPPNKGDKIRSWHALRHLAARYEVHLGAFVDDRADWVHRERLATLCASVHLVPLTRTAGLARSLTGLVTGRALTVPYYGASSMHQWVRATVHRHAIRRLFAFSAAMAQFDMHLPEGARRVLDMVDVDSDKWRQYAERGRGPAAGIHAREARRLLAYERAAAARFDRTLLVSAAEVALFADRAPETAERLAALANGVDTAYFDPRLEHPDPYPAGCRPVVFTGAMDYWPNVDAVTWFADAVLPRIRARTPEARFFVAGARPAPAVAALDARADCRVVGAVPDMRPWLAHAQAVVAPLRIARGIQNKVLEGFAMNRPVVATPAALEGLELEPGYPLCADDAESFADRVAEVLADEVGLAMRPWVERHYHWDQRLAPLASWLEGDADASTVPDVGGEAVAVQGLAS